MNYLNNWTQAHVMCGCEGIQVVLKIPHLFLEAFCSNDFCVYKNISSLLLHAFHAYMHSIYACTSLILYHTQPCHQQLLWYLQLFSRELPVVIKNCEGNPVTWMPCTWRQIKNAKNSTKNSTACSHAPAQLAVYFITVLSSKPRWSGFTTITSLLQY